MMCYSIGTELVLRRLVESTQYTSIAFTERLAESGIDPSVGSVGDAYDTPWPRA